MKDSINTSPWRENKSRIILSVSLGIFYLVLFFLFYNRGFNYLWILPAGMVILLFALTDIENFLLPIVFFVPLSIQLRFILPETPSDLFLPTELMLPIALVIIIFKLAVTKEIDRRILVHPVSVIVFLLLGWEFITSLTSTIPLVSFKSLTTKLWFIACFYFLAAQIFRRREKMMRYFMAYLLGMLPVVIIFIVKMWKSGLFNQSAAYLVSRPFFNDHTAIGASLAFCIPVIIYFMFRKGSAALFRFFVFLLLIIFSSAFVLSYSRAAWLSLAIAAIFGLILVLKIPWRVVIPASAVLVVVLISTWSSLIIRLNENREVSSADFSKHIKSIANISTDASNMERLNRWKSALRMSAEKPLLGWGPATYQFSYAPYQMASEKTIISTNWGVGGNAHSEYLGALVDSGVCGLILYISLILTTVYRGVVSYRTANDRQTTALLLMLLCGIFTYVVHGGLNNFLDTDKISALFWGMAAAIVSIDTETGEGKKALDQ